MARTLQTAFEFYRRSQLQPMTLPAKLRALSKLLRDNLPATLQGVGVVAPIFAGVEPPTGRQTGISFTTPSAPNSKPPPLPAPAPAPGAIKSVLHYLENWGHPRPAELPLAEAVVLANRLLITAAEFDSATGGVHPESRVATIKLLSARARAASRRNKPGSGKRREVTILPAPHLNRNPNPASPNLNLDCIKITIKIKIQITIRIRTSPNRNNLYD